jgi:hypothetical protein
MSLRGKYMNKLMKLFFFCYLSIILLSSLSFATGKIIKPFCTDGCTGAEELSADPDAYRCCVQHDYAYWVGGDDYSRRAADSALRSCVQKAKAKNDFFDFFSTPVALAVATFGDEYWSSAWGETKHPFDSLTEEEKELIKNAKPADIYAKEYRCP